jgi:hypothetical protein
MKISYFKILGWVLRDRVRPDDRAHFGQYGNPTSVSPHSRAAGIEISAIARPFLTPIQGTKDPHQRVGKAPLAEDSWLSSPGLETRQCLDERRSWWVTLFLTHWRDHQGFFGGHEDPH